MNQFYIDLFLYFVQLSFLLYLCAGERDGESPNDFSNNFVKLLVLGLRFVILLTMVLLCKD